MSIPPLNHKLLLFKWIAELSLPRKLPLFSFTAPFPPFALNKRSHPQVDTFTALDHLLTLLNLDFTFPLNTRVTPLSVHPEIRLIALLIIIVKLFYPFDSRPRYPTTVTEPAAAVINWDVWNVTRSRYNGHPKAKGAKSHERYLDTTDEDVMRMSERDLDGFMDWFGRTYVGEHEEVGRDADFRRAVNGMFPADVGVGGDQEEAEGSMDEETRDRVGRLAEVLGALDVRRPVRDCEQDESEGGKAKVLRPGAQYKQWRSEADVPERALPFVKAAADLVNLSVGALVTAVFQLERRLQVWDTEERKKDKGKQKRAIRADSETSEANYIASGSAMEVD